MFPKLFEYGEVVKNSHLGQFAQKWCDIYIKVTAQPIFNYYI